MFANTWLHIVFSWFSGIETENSLSSHVSPAEGKHHAQIQKHFDLRPIYLPLMRFMLPVMLAAFLQALYGAVDLIVIGRFATAAVETGISPQQENCVLLNYRRFRFIMILLRMLQNEPFKEKPL